MWNKIERILDGHVSIGRLTAYGANAMQWGCTFKTKRWGYLYWRLPLPCFGRWWPLYFYVSPNATPWAATFMMGKSHDVGDWKKAPLRRKAFGHNFNVNDNYKRLHSINDSA